MAENRIYNEEKIKRIFDFSKLPKVGTRSPTDIDAPPIPFCMELGDQKKYLIGDFKEEGKWFHEPYDGQQILLERHVKAFHNFGYVAVAFLAWHPKGLEIIDVAETIVVLYYYNNSWMEPENEKKFLTKYMKFFDIPIVPNNNENIKNEITDKKSIENQKEKIQSDLSFEPYEEQSNEQEQEVRLDPWWDTHDPDGEDGGVPLF